MRWLLRLAGRVAATICVLISERLRVRTGASRAGVRGLYVVLCQNYGQRHKKIDLHFPQIQKSGPDRGCHASDLVGPLTGDSTINYQKIGSISAPKHVRLSAARQAKLPLSLARAPPKPHGASLCALHYPRPLVTPADPLLLARPSLGGEDPLLPHHLHARDPGPANKRVTGPTKDFPRGSTALGIPWAPRRALFAGVAIARRARDPARLRRPGPRHGHGGSTIDGKTVEHFAVDTGEHER